MPNGAAIIEVCNFVASYFMFTHVLVSANLDQIM